jgi:hypothetical protein
MTTVIPAVWTIYKNATGDVGVVKTATIKNADGTLKDLTNLSMALKVWDGDPTQPILTSTNLANDGTPTDGVVNWTVSSADIAALPVRPDGLYAAIRFTAASYQDTTDPFVLVVRATG